jgi:hypothetical protein
MEQGNSTDATELQLRQYELLQHRADRERQWRLVRMTGGTGVTAAVIAYAVAVGELAFVAVTPILYGITMMAGLRSTVEILYLDRQMIRLESKLRATEEEFSWVTEYGPFGDGQALYAGGVDLNGIPRTALAVLLAAAYFVLVVLGLATWDPGATADGGVTVTTELLGVSYASFSLVFVAIAAVGALHYRRLQRDVRNQ